MELFGISEIFVIHKISESACNAHDGCNGTKSQADGALSELQNGPYDYGIGGTDGISSSSAVFETGGDWKVKDKKLLF